MRIKKSTEEKALLLEEEVENEFQIVGYRYSNEYIKPGNILPPSNHWEEDIPTNKVLEGTCAFKDLIDLKEYISQTPQRGYFYMIGGEFAGYGELPGEVLISDSKVLFAEKL